MRSARSTLTLLSIGLGAGLALGACVDAPDDAATLDDAEALEAKLDPPFSVTPTTLPLAVDLDHDGYTTGSGPRDDCNDLDASIHPYNIELPNSVDDNCDGVTDEPMLSYAPTRPPESATYPQLADLRLRISDAATVAYLNSNSTVTYDLTYEALASASGPTPPAASGSLAISFHDWISATNVFTGQTTHTLTVNPNDPARGWLARTPYRMKIQLRSSIGANLGPQSDWFYVVTGGTSAGPSTSLQWARVDIALRAFDQYGDSEDGLIGSHGSYAPDGQRFTASNLVPLHPKYDPVDETGWCDWFVHYIGAVVSDGADGNLAANVVVDGGSPFWHDMNPDNVPNAFRDPDGDGCGSENGDVDGDGVPYELIDKGCQDYADGTVLFDGDDDGVDDNQFFANTPGNVYYSAIKSKPENQAMSNYEAIAGHAGIFLAFDPAGDGTFDGAGTIGTVWSIEGNVSGKVAVMHRTSDNANIKGYGKLTLAMFQ